MLDQLTLDQLRIFVAIADAGSFSAASRKLMRAQSAISQSVRSLEDALGVALFDRATRVPQMTEAGRSILIDARRIINLADALRVRTRRMAEGLEPELGLAIDPLFPPAIAMDCLAAFERQFPTIPMTVLTESIGGPERHLRSGAVQMAIYALETTGATDLHADFLMDVEMVPVVSARHPLAALPEPVGREDLEQFTQIVLTSGSGQSGWTRGVISPRIWRVADLRTRLAFLIAGFGWSHMPAHFVAAPLAEGTLKRLHLHGIPDFSLRVYLVQQFSRPPGIAARWLIERLKQGIAEQA